MKLKSVDRPGIINDITNVELSLKAHLDLHASQALPVSLL